MVGPLEQEKFSEEEGTADMRDDQLSVAAKEAETATPCPVFLEDRGSVGKAAPRETERTHETLELAAHHKMIVHALGIPGKPLLRREGTGMIAESQTYHGLNLRHKQTGIEAHGGITLKITHVRVPPLAKPLQVIGLHLLGDRPGRSHLTM